MSAIVLACWIAPGCGDSSSDSEGGDATPANAPQADPEEALSRVTALSDRFSTAIDEQRDTAPLLLEARQLAAAYPEFAPAQALLGQVLLQNNQFERAYEAFTASLHLDPRQPEVESLAGAMAMNLDRLDDAERHFASAVRLEPANARRRVFLANVYLAQDRFDDARATLDEALRLDAALHEAHFALAQLDQQAGHADAARDHLRRAIELARDEPRRLAYSVSLAEMMLAGDDPAAALELINDLPPRLRLDERAMSVVARAYGARGEPLAAARLYEQALTILPISETFAAEAARWYHRAGDHDAAVRMIQQLRQINPGSTQLPELGRLIMETDQ